MGRISTKLAELNITLPTPPKPVASYVTYVQTGNLVYISGQLPSKDGQIVYKGQVPKTGTPEDAKAAARLATINALAVLNDACGGNLDRVKRIVRLGVWVQNACGFEGQPAIANGASDLLVEVFGEAGKHARAAVGTNSLPLGAIVEIELLAEIE